MFFLKPIFLNVPSRRHAVRNQLLTSSVATPAASRTSPSFEFLVRGRRDQGEQWVEKFRHRCLVVCWMRLHIRFTPLCPCSVLEDAKNQRWELLSRAFGPFSLVTSVPYPVDVMQITSILDACQYILEDQGTRNPAIGSPRRSRI